MTNNKVAAQGMSGRRYFLTKWTVWEFLPWWLANIPVYCFYTWFALRARHLFFFTNVDPAIPLGGSMGESKHDILKILPPAVVPKTVFVQPGDDFAGVLQQINAAGIGFPLIAKPDVGERGFLVGKIPDAGALQTHLSRYPVPFIIQEFLTLPVELSVLFHRYPENGSFGITSVCIKEFLSVTGDGISTVRALMAGSPRAAFQLDRFERDFPSLLDEVPAAGKHLLLEPIGNHARGTKFLNGNDLIDDALVAAFKPVCESLDGILYGRFDLKCASEEALRRGEFKVMELNGVLGEPAHIYDPSFGMWKAYRDLYRHWRLLYRLHRAQRKLGVYPTPYREAFGMIRGYFRYKKALEG
jgi:hypothetical protein